MLENHRLRSVENHRIACWRIIFSKSWKSSSKIIWKSSSGKSMNINEQDRASCRRNTHAHQWTPNGTHWSTKRAFEANDTNLFQTATARAQSSPLKLPAHGLVTFPFDTSRPDAKPIRPEPDPMQTRPDRSRPDAKPIRAVPDFIQSVSDKSRPDAKPIRPETDPMRTRSDRSRPDATPIRAEPNFI